MPRFGWTRLAYLLLVLSVLAVLARPATPGAETRPLAADSPRNAPPTAEEPSDALKPPGTTTETARRIERALPYLADLDGEENPPGRQGSSAGARLPTPEDAPSESPDREVSPPVFYLPAAAGRSFGVPGTAGPVCGDLGKYPESSRVVFPLEDRYYYSYEDTWGAPRTQGGHEGTDLMAPAGAPEYAVTDGTVVPVAGSNENGWNSLGGYAVMVRADYSVGPVEEGDLFYYAHLGRPSPLKVGARVRAGQVVGYAGDTGQGPEITRGLFPAHLHFGWYDATGTRSTVDSGAMNPYPLLEWIRANGGAVAGGSNARFCEAPTPFPGEGGWPTPVAPGVRPDLDTGSKDPKPSPVLRGDARGPARTLPAERADPARRPAPISQSRAPSSAPRAEYLREAPEETRAIERPDPPRPPKPTAPDLPDPGPAPSKPSQQEPSGREPADPPLPELTSPVEVERDEPPAETVTPDLRGLLERLAPDLVPDRGDRPVLTDRDRQDQERERERARGQTGAPAERHPAERHPEDQPAGRGPENSPEPPVEQTQPEETTSPETTTSDIAEEPEPETTEPLPETTAVPETTTE